MRYIVIAILPDYRIWSQRFWTREAAMECLDYVLDHSLKSKLIEDFEKQEMLTEESNENVRSSSR